MVRFFHQPTTQGVTFSPKPTQFYADVYHTQTLHEAITACTYRSNDGKHGLYKISTINKTKSKNLQSISETPSIVFETGSYQKNHSSSPASQITQSETTPLLQWKIIAPTGIEEHSSVEYATNPSQFYTVWDSLECSTHLASRADGKKSLQVSVGDQQTCHQARLKWKEMDRRAREDCRSLAFMYENSPWIMLSDAKKFHTKSLKYAVRKSKEDVPEFAIKAQELMALAPPMIERPTPHQQSIMLQHIKTGEVIEKILLICNQKDVEAYNKSLIAHIWLCAELRKMNKKLAPVYWGNLKRIIRTLCATPKKKHFVNYAHHYIHEVDRICEHFYSQYPELKPKPFTAIAPLRK